MLNNAKELTNNDGKECDTKENDEGADDALFVGPGVEVTEANGRECRNRKVKSYQDFRAGRHMQHVADEMPFQVGIATQSELDDTVDEPVTASQVQRQHCVEENLDTYYQVSDYNLRLDNRPVVLEVLGHDRVRQDVLESKIKNL